MKRVKQVGLVLVMALVVVGVSGCGKSISDNEKAMKEYATTYYNNFMIGMIEAQNSDSDIQLNVARVSISMLKQANESDQVTDKFDMSKLSNCSEDSYVDLTVDEETQEIVKYEFNLSCK